jgi:hypothetical protein
MWRLLGNICTRTFAGRFTPDLSALPEQSKEDLLKEISGIIGITTGMDVGHTICY